MEASTNEVLESLPNPKPRLVRVTPLLKSRVTPSSVNAAVVGSVHPASAKEMVPGIVSTAVPDSLMKCTVPEDTSSTFMRPVM